MTDIVGKTINQSYLVTKESYKDEFVTNYLAKDKDNNEYLVVRLNNFGDDDSKEEMMKSFYNIANFFKKSRIGNIPIIVNAIKGQSENIIILKKHPGTPITKHLQNLDKPIGYKETFEYIKALLISIDILSRNNIFFSIDSLLDITIENNAISINSPITFKKDINKINKQICHLYYCILTKHSFYPEKKLPSQYGIKIPEELESFIYEVLTDKLEFLTVASFYNKLYDSITFSPIQNSDKKELDEAEEFEVSTVRFILEVIIFLLIFAFLIVSLVLAGKNIFNKFYGADTYILKAKNTDLYQEIDGNIEVKDKFLRSSYLYTKDAVKNFDVIFEYLLEKYNIKNKNEFESYQVSWVSILGNSEIVISENNITLMNYYDYNSYSYNLLILNENTGEEIIIDSDIEMESPIFVGDKIFFISTNDNNELYSMNIDGTDIKKVLQQEVGFLQKSSNESKLYFVALAEEDGMPIIYEMDLVSEKISVFEDSYTQKNYNIFLYIESQDLLRNESMDFYDRLVSEMEYDYFYIDINYIDDSYIYLDVHTDSLMLSNNDNIKIIDSYIYNIKVHNDKLYIIKNREEDKIWEYNLDTNQYELIYNEGYIIYCILDDKMYIEIFRNLQDSELVKIIKNVDGFYEEEKSYSFKDDLSL